MMIRYNKTVPSVQVEASGVSGSISFRCMYVCERGAAPNATGVIAPPDGRCSNAGSVSDLQLAPEGTRGSYEPIEYRNSNRWATWFMSLTRGSRSRSTL